MTYFGKQQRSMSNDIIIVTDQTGTRGRLPEGTDADRVVVELEEGARFRVDAHRLTPREGGGFRYEGTFPDDTASSADVIEEHRIPLAREELNVHRETRETGRVRIRKTVNERTETVDEPVFEEAVDVRRVPVDRVLDEPAAIRREGEVTIIPVMEERIVVRKELVLKEELHVRTRRTETRDQHDVTLRSEEAVVMREHVDASPEEAADEAPAAGRAAATSRGASTDGGAEAHS